MIILSSAVSEIIISPIWIFGFDFVFLVLPIIDGIMAIKSGRVEAGFYVTANVVLYIGFCLMFFDISYSKVTLSFI